MMETLLAYFGVWVLVVLTIYGWPVLVAAGILLVYTILYRTTVALGDYWYGDTEQYRSGAERGDVRYMVVHDLAVVHRSVYSLLDWFTELAESYYEVVAPWR